MKNAPKSETKSLYRKGSLLLCVLFGYGLGLLTVMPNDEPRKTADVLIKSSEAGLAEDTISPFSEASVVAPPGSTSKPDCVRSCPPDVRHQNAIIYLGREGAGLKDGRNVIKHMLKFAGYLCATLYVPPPSFLLGAQHNDGEYVDSRIRWSDFFDFRFKEDDTVAVFDLEAARNFTHSERDEDSRNVDGFVEKLFPRGPKPFRLKSGNPTQVASDFLELDKFVKLQRRGGETDKFFVWEVRKNFYVFRNQLNESLQELAQSMPDEERRSLPYWCEEYVHDDTVPRVIRTLATNVWGKVRQRYPSSIYGTMHVRRGDTIDWCDTSIPQMKKFLLCSFNGTSALGNFTVLFQSDERDITYRKQVKKIVNDLGVQFVDLDWYVRQEVEGKLLSEMHTNYYTFAVLKAFDPFTNDGTFQYPGYPEISNQMFFSFKHHKHICPRCTPLAKENRLRNKLKKAVTAVRVEP